MQYFAILCYTLLYLAILGYTLPYFAILGYTWQSFAILCYTLLYFAIFCYILLYFTIFCYNLRFESTPYHFYLNSSKILISDFPILISDFPFDIGLPFLFYLNQAKFWYRILLEFKQNFDIGLPFSFYLNSSKILNSDFPPTDRVLGSCDQKQMPKYFWNWQWMRTPLSLNGSSLTQNKNFSSLRGF